MESTSISKTYGRAEGLRREKRRRDCPRAREDPKLERWLPRADEVIIWLLLSVSRDIWEGCRTPCTVRKLPLPRMLLPTPRKFPLPRWPARWVPLDRWVALAPLEKLEVLGRFWRDSCLASRELVRLPNGPARGSGVHGVTPARSRIIARYGTKKRNELLSKRKGLTATHDGRRPCFARLAH